MRAPPLDVVLSWPPPDYDAPFKNAPAGISISVFLMVIVTAILGIRIYTRKYITRGFGPDDILIIFAYIPCLGFSISGMIAQVYYGWGKDLWNVRPAIYKSALQSAFGAYTLFGTATTLIKLSMLAMTYRLACTASKTFKRIVVGCMILVGANGICFLLVTWLQCRPLHLYWTISHEKQNCIDEPAHLLAAGTINTVTDLLVVILPLVIFIKLQGPNSMLSRRQVFIVNILFAAGFFATIAGAVRTYVTWRMTSAPDFNITHWFWLTWLSSMIEIYVGIIAASVPATKPFMAQYVPMLLGATKFTNSPTCVSRTDRYALPASLSHTKNGYVRDDSYDLPFYESISTVTLPAQQVATTSSFNTTEEETTLQSTIELLQLEIMSFPIIHINGYPGTGKLTIARKLVDLLLPYNGKLVHNHLLIDPVGAILPRSSPDYQHVRRALRSVIFVVTSDTANASESVFVFTDFQSDDNIGRSVIAEYRDMVARRRCIFVPITVTCSKDENLRRLSSSERIVHGKLADTEMVTHLRDHSLIHQWSKDDPLHMELDITELKTNESARVIFEHVLRVCKELDRS
ncbi:hypothetical protein FVEN_g7154 [Fusarium venenatum]|nr:hypothetical protein FVEN_g7154 [Fusarium venenatum]